jgi:hypothetical protein
MSVKTSTVILFSKFYNAVYTPAAVLARGAPLLVRHAGEVLDDPALVTI